MYEGWFCLGGTEIVNSERARGLAESSDCPVTWFTGDRCEGLSSALGDIGYDSSSFPQAPWYDAGEPEISTQFYGVYGLTVTGLEDSTRGASVTESILDGGVVGRVRKGTRRVRFRVLLTAQNATAMEYGRAWLSAALDTVDCGMHAGACGTADLSFMVDCPPAGSADDEAYAAEVDEMMRYLHTVTCVSGPLMIQEFERDGTRGEIIEFTLVAGTPAIFRMTQQVFPPTSGSYAIEDIAYNLVPYPSATLSEGTVVAARNLSLNPSVETNSTEWNNFQSIISGSNPISYLAASRSNDIAADGTWSQRLRLLGNLSTAAAGRSFIDLYQDRSLSGLPAGTRISFTEWAALIATTGSSSVLHSLEVFIEWRDAFSSWSMVESIGKITSGFAGHVFSAKSKPIPLDTLSVPAAFVRVYVRADVSWASSATPAVNSDIRLYADALGITIP